MYQTQLLVQSTALIQGKYEDSDFYPRLLADAAWAFPCMKYFIGIDWDVLKPSGNNQV